MTDLKLVPDRTCQDLAQAHHDTPQWLQVYQRYKIIAETTSRRTDTQKKNYPAARSTSDACKKADLDYE